MTAGIVKFLTVRFLSVPYAIDGYSLLVIENLIEDTIITDPDTVFGLASSKFNT
jgi:hypothetical protein